ncbi:SAM-dependent methyltransferase [Pseudonocardia sediminis]|nr:SAM-dependent methyltransferase [Pseudonocardia sediminis]
MTDVRLPPGVGWTALLTAYARAQEQRRADPLFDDPWAGPLIGTALGATGGELPRLGPARDDGTSVLWEMFGAYFAAGRTPFFDDQVRAGVADGAEQVVLLAAGMDARAARLDLPEDVRVYEVDTAPVLDFKAAVLGGTGTDVRRRTPVVADLREDWPSALAGAGFRPGRPTVWIVEGLLMYLDAQACDRLVTTAREASGPGSRIAVEYFRRIPEMDSVPPVDEAEKEALELILGLFRSGPSADPATWLGGLGITPAQVTEVPDELRRLGRPVPAVLDLELTTDPMRIWLAAGTF